MIKNFDEVPQTIEGLNFFIMAGEKALKDFKNKHDRMESLLAEAKQRLKAYEDSPKKEVLA